MRNVHTLKDISSDHRLGSVREMELEEILRNSIKSISELTNEYNDMQGVYSSYSKRNDRDKELSNSPPSPMNDSSQKLPGWLSDDLRPLVYELGLENKVMELDKSFARENILEALQKLLPRDEIIMGSQADILPNQYVHSQPTHSDEYISSKGLRSN
ncbi:hypothetical protein RhiirC2_719668 [Rhizophagus irregularis]|uniref:Uncharacterized protein n=1 Tax=Rhizophagus irregularis TaxID=588596 RepID=A0A2N1MDF1_9GLOM|nr:hypothetical protein RhiirC2_719668 [Rhizophagus irregularis]